MNVEWRTTDEKIIKYANSSLNFDNVQLYIEKLHYVMDKEKVFLDNEIRLADLAKKINLSSHHLSQIINQHFKISFFDFVNRYRTKEAKRVISKNPERKLLQVAFDSGFNNKTSFVNSFKKFEKTTPSRFRETIINS
jgi:YesN/AraC family two-component response regulator